MDEKFEWFVGIDWASETHQVCLLDAKGNVIGEKAFAHGGEGLAEMGEWLCESSGAAPPAIAVAIEVPHGPVVETLLERGFAMHALNPKQLDRFRDRFTAAGAKDDRRDARVAGDALRTDRRHFRRLDLEDPIVIELREWSRMAEDLQQERTRLTNRMREQLWRYYPQMLELSDDLGVAWLSELWTLVPTPAEAARARKSRIAAILKEHRVRRIDAAGALAILRQPPLAVSAGTIAAATAHIGAVLARVKLVNQQIKQAGKKLDELCDALAARDPDGGSQDTGVQSADGASEATTPGQQRVRHDDVTIMRSMPGLGRVIMAVVFAEASQPLRERDYQTLRCLSGAAPVTKRSGKSRIVVMRQACHMRLRTALYHWARVASQRDAACRARYRALRARGRSHARCLRAIADRLLAIACAMLRQGTLYDPQHTTRRIEHPSTAHTSTAQAAA